MKEIPQDVQVDCAIAIMDMSKFLLERVRSRAKPLTAQEAIEAIEDWMAIAGPQRVARVIFAFTKAEEEK